MRPTDRRVRTWAGKNFACPRSVATACSGALFQVLVQKWLRTAAHGRKNHLWLRRIRLQHSSVVEAGRALPRSLTLEQRREADPQTAQDGGGKKKGRKAGEREDER